MRRGGGGEGRRLRRLRFDGCSAGGRTGLRPGKGWVLATSDSGRRRGAMDGTSASGRATRCSSSFARRTASASAAAAASISGGDGDAPLVGSVVKVKGGWV